MHRATRRRLLALVWLGAFASFGGPSSAQVAAYPTKPIQMIVAYPPGGGTDRAARLIAAGLMPLAGLKPDVTLQFHIAAVLLDERYLEATELAEALDALLAAMSPRTRRPIRFVAPINTQPAGLGDSSVLTMEDESSAPKRRAAAAH